MKTLILYASVHHGNTKKLVDAIAEGAGVDTFDVMTDPEVNFDDYEYIGLASGIYAAKMHPKLIQFVKEHLPNDKKIFFIMTSAMNKDFSKSMNSALEGKNAKVIGTFSCKGYNTFGPFKLVGGTSKGHPDAEDIQNAIHFYELITRK